MRILFVHNYYQQPGGEDAIFADEAALLREHGHEVRCYTQHNDAIPGLNRLSLAAKTVWNRQTFRELRALARAEDFDLMHLFNTFPLVSPSAIHAARAERLPVVQTVQNYRLVCPNAQLLRQGTVCHDCLGRRLAWPAVRHACYRDDRAASSVVTLMLGAHRLLGSWSRGVDLFIAPTPEIKRLLEEHLGAPELEVLVKPNFVAPDPGAGDGAGGYALFVGRLAPEKGVRTLLDAWDRLEEPLRLKIAGSGPLEVDVARAAARDRHIEWLGWQPRESVVELLRRAALLVFPSLWYEGMPRAILESFAAGTPVLASDLGTMREMVEPGRNGILFPAGDTGKLADHLVWAARHAEVLAGMRPEARRTYERKYTGERNYSLLMEAYERALAHSRARQSTGAFTLPA